MSPAPQRRVLVAPFIVGRRRRRASPHRAWTLFLALASLFVLPKIIDPMAEGFLRLTQTRPPALAVRSTAKNAGTARAVPVGQANESARPSSAQSEGSGILLGSARAEAEELPAEPAPIENTVAATAKAPTVTATPKPHRAAIRPHHVKTHPALALASSDEGAGKAESGAGAETTARRRSGLGLSIAPK